MNLFRRKKKSDVEIETKVIELTLAGIARRVVHDGILGDPAELSEAMELPPVSDEVFDMEMSESHRRMHEVDSVVPLLETHALVMGRVGVAAYQLHNPEREMDQETEEEMQQLFRMISFSASLTAVSLLQDLGIIDIAQEVHTHEH